MELAVWLTLTVTVDLTLYSMSRIAEKDMPQIILHHTNTHTRAHTYTGVTGLYNHIYIINGGNPSKCLSVCLFVCLE